MAPLWEYTENGKKCKIRSEELDKIAYIYWWRESDKLLNLISVSFYQLLSTISFFLEGSSFLFYSVTY